MWIFGDLYCPLARCQRQRSCSLGIVMDSPEGLPDPRDHLSCFYWSYPVLDLPWIWGLIAANHCVWKDCNLRFSDGLLNEKTENLRWFIAHGTVFSSRCHAFRNYLRLSGIARSAHEASSTFSYIDGNPRISARASCPIVSLNAAQNRITLLLFMV